MLLQYRSGLGTFTILDTGEQTDFKTAIVYIMYIIRLSATHGTCTDNVADRKAKYINHLHKDLKELNDVK